MRTFGVEEELLLVDATTGVPRPLSPEILVRADDDATEFSLTFEMEQEMIEVVSPPCRTAEELRRHIVEGRRTADELAAESDARAVAIATSPFPVRPHASPKPRYQAIVERYRGLAAATLECGLHVHVSIDDAEEGIAVLNGIRAWLPVLIALSANSPFRDGEDTGYASFRRLVGAGWPSSGPLDVLSGPEEYEELVQTLVETGGVIDDAMLLFDARLSRRFPTVEVRVADVCLDPDDSVVIAMLIRGLVDVVADDRRRGVEVPAVPTHAVRVASWMAARWGLHGDLVHPATGRAVPAADAVEALLARAKDGLRRHGDRERASRGVRDILARGTGADAQRARYARTGTLAAVVLGEDDVEEAASGGVPARGRLRPSA